MKKLNVMLMFVLVALSAQTSFAERNRETQEVQIAYQADAKVIARQEQLKQMSLHATEPRLLFLTENCGFVGCTWSYLVVQNFVHWADGPTLTIIATVSGTARPSGKNPEVKLVQITPLD